MSPVPSSRSAGVMPTDAVSDNVTIGNAYGEKSFNNAPMQAFPFLEALRRRLAERSVAERLARLESLIAESFGEPQTWQNPLNHTLIDPQGRSDIFEAIVEDVIDMQGRSSIYEAIVKGEITDDPKLPESFNVLVRELQALCQDVDILKLKGR